MDNKKILLDALTIIAMMTESRTSPYKMMSASKMGLVAAEALEKYKKEQGVQADDSIEAVQRAAEKKHICVCRYCGAEHRTA